MGARLSGPSGQGGRTIEQNADINVTPFVDIMLVLLIIFMVAAPLATVSLKLDLPPPIDSVAPKEPVYVTVQTSGALFIGGRATTLETLAADVCAAAGGGACTDERIFVRAQPHRLRPCLDHHRAVPLLEAGRPAHQAVGSHLDHPVAHRWPEPLRC